MESNRHYKFRVDNYPLMKQPNEGQELYFGEGLNYKTGKGLTLDLYLKDGSRHLVHYSYLIYAWFETKDNLQQVKIFQTTHMIIIKGYRLEVLYEKIKGHNLEYIKESNPTEIAIADDNEPFISEIELDWRSKGDKED